MTKPTDILAARASASDLEPITRQALARALAARQALTELTPGDTQQVAGAATFSGGQIVPGWWIYGQPAFTLSQSVINQGINKVNPGTIALPRTFG